MDVISNLPWEAIKSASIEHGLAMDLIAAVIMTESNGVQYSSRYEPLYKYTINERIWADKLGITPETEDVHQKTSWGYMHVMGGRARELNYSGHLPGLCNSDTAIFYGCLAIKDCIRRFGNDYSDIYAAYNAGSVRKTDGGLYVNQQNVDRFDTNLRAIRDSGILNDKK